MNNIRYLLAAKAAALMAAAEVYKDYSDNTPDDAQEELIDGDGNVVVAAVIASGVADLDASGLPHHPTIHASTKNKKADGTWIKRKGVDDITYNAVVAELRLTHPAPAAAPSPAPAPAAIIVPGGPKLNLTPPVAKTPYTELCEFLAANVANSTFTQEWVDTNFAASNTQLAALAADLPMAAQWLEAFKGAAANITKT